MHEVSHDQMEGSRKCDKYSRSVLEGIKRRDPIHKLDHGAKTYVYTK